MARRTSRDTSTEGASPGPEGDSAESRALRLSRNRKLPTSAFLQELAARPDFIEGV